MSLEQRHVNRVVTCHYGCDVSLTCVDTEFPDHHVGVCGRHLSERANDEHVAVSQSRLVDWLR